MTYSADPTEIRGEPKEGGDLPEMVVPIGIIRWEDPPPRGSSFYAPTAEALKTSWAWALVDEQKADYRPNVAQWRRHLNALLDGQAEVREVTVNGQTRVYARRKPLEDTAS